MSHNLTTGSLKLPFTEGFVPRISSLFDDPRRGVDGWTESHLLKHEGIDWGCGADAPIYPMSSGTVTLVRNPETGPHPDYGYLVTVRTGSVGHGFTLTYAHLSTVTVAMGDKVIPYDPSLKENTEPDQKKNTPLGTSGSTGNSTGPHLHVHFIPDSATGPLPGFIGHYRNFQEYLPAGHYIWPDIKSLQDQIDATTAGSDKRATLVKDIDKWMNNALRGGTNPNEARLWVKPERKVYMLPRVDEEFAYPCRPFPGSAIVGMNQVMWDLFHSLMFTDATPIPNWWRIKINPSFPACWVRNEDTEEIGE